MQSVSFCCALQDKVVQITQIFAARSLLVAAGVLQALQKSILFQFRFPVYKLLFIVYQ